LRSRSYSEVYGEEVSPQVSGDEGYYKAVARLRSGNRILTENDFEFLVIDRSKPAPPSKPIVLLDPEDNLRKWMQRRGFPLIEFTEWRGKPHVVLVAGMKDPSGYYEIYDELRKLGQMVKEGSVAVFLEGNFNDLMYLFLRFNIGQQSGVGSFVGNFHCVKPHPVFQGLPMGCLMDWEYTDIWAVETMKETTIGNLNPQTIVGCFSTTGDGGTEWGSEMFITSQGEGRVLMSKLRLTETVDRDPVAERIVMNMLAWAAEGLA